MIKSNTKSSYKTHLVLSFMLIAFFNVNAHAVNSYGLSSESYEAIENRVSLMSYNELISNKSSLQEELEELEDEAGNTQSPSQNKAIQERMSEILAELSAIQRAIVAIVGVAGVSALTDDGYNDNVPPVITLLGDNPATVELGSTYTDAGALANDAFHGATPVTSSGNVDTSTIGTYTITYTATDLDANTATATRTFNVVDTTTPTIATIAGDNPANVELGSSYTDAGATATDLSGDVDVVSTGTVDPDTLGVYTITYTSTDSSGNTATDSRTVNVVDTTIPVFTSSSTFIVDEGATDVGTVTATDIQDVTFTISGTDLAITAAGVLTFVSPVITKHNLMIQVHCLMMEVHMI